MLSEIDHTLIDILRSELCQILLPEDFRITDVKNLAFLAAQQDLQHLVYHAVKENHLPEIDQFDEYSFNTAMFRYLRQQTELRNLEVLFEQNHITYVPLKGMVLRRLYPQPWMRSCADIDILIHEKDLENTIELLKRNFHFEQEKSYGHHDISLYSSDHDVHLELHYSLIEEGRVDDAIVRVLSRVWDHVNPVTEGSSHEEMSDEMLYFYHIAHMAKHFTKGGNCGIRYLMDLWLLNQHLKGNNEKCNDLLTEAGLLTFAQKMSAVADGWFGPRQHLTDERLERYIIRNSLYGSAISQVSYKYYENSGKKWRIALHRAFPPREILSESYPVLNKAKALTPLFWGVRFFDKIVDPKARRKLCVEYQALQNVEDKDAANYIQIINDLGLRNNGDPRSVTDGN